MLEAEEAAGVAEADLKGLESTIRVLSTAAAREVGVGFRTKLNGSWVAPMLGCYHREPTKKITRGDVNEVRSFLGMPTLNLALEMQSQEKSDS